MKLLNKRVSVLNIKIQDAQFKKGIDEQIFTNRGQIKQNSYL